MARQPHRMPRATPGHRQATSADAQPTLSHATALRRPGMTQSRRRPPDARRVVVAVATTLLYLVIVLALLPA